MPKNFVQEPFSVSLISGIEKFQPSEGYVTIFCRIFSSDIAESFVEEPFSAVFQKVPLAKTFMERRGGGEYQAFTSQFFVS